jgi:2-C-methyl-D-erythritol 4-phosphate cytidylyltransferase
MLEVSKKAELIAIHDAARPFADENLISAVVRRASELGACIPVIPVKETIRFAKAMQWSIRRTGIRFTHTDSSCV